MGKLIIAPVVVLFYINLSKTVTFWKGNKGILNWSRPLGKLVKQNEIWMLKIFVDKLEFFEHLWIWQEYFSSVFFIFFSIGKVKKKVVNETWRLISFNFLPYGVTRIETKLSLIGNLKGTNTGIWPKFKEINVIDLIEPVIPMEKDKESFATALKPWKNPRLLKK